MTDKAYRLQNAAENIAKVAQEAARFQNTMREYGMGKWTDDGLLDQAQGRLKGIALQALKEAIEDINAAMDGED